MALSSNSPLSTDASSAADLLVRIRREIHTVVVGQDLLIDRLLIGMLVSGHVLVEGVPGLAKSLTVTTLANVLDVSSIRIQFTPDLLPADLIGTEVLNPAEGKFAIRKGPIFAHIVLADEINRAPAKVQSALLEAMQERQVSIGGQTLPMPDPFFVMATQNPIEQEGTYPLPEAQLDRFLLKVRVDYPNRQEERDVLEAGLSGGFESPVRGIASHDEVLAARESLASVTLDDSLKDYCIQIVQATRRPAAYRLPELRSYIAYGASPRATIALARTARAHALLQGRGYTMPEDVKALAHDVLRHRIVTTYEADAEEITTDEIIDRLLEAIEVP